MAEVGYHWAPIEDLPDNWRGFSSSELHALFAAWNDHAAKLRESESIREFNLRLRREWAIETGIIENLYTIDRGTTQLLIERGIRESLIPFGSSDKPAEHVVPILKDQEEVVEGLFEFVGQRRELSTSYIKQLHQTLTRHQDLVPGVNGLGRQVEIPLLKGDWRRQPNNPTRPSGEIHEYCPPEHVAAEMDRLIDLHRRHRAIDVPPEIEAAWLHHRFTQIHPFQDGNGRVARALASLVFLRSGWFPLVVDRDRRGEYIEALEKADRGDLQDLVRLFGDVERMLLNKALSISEDILHGRRPIGEVIAAAVERLREREREREQEVYLAKRLTQVAKKRLQSVAAELKREIKGVNDNYTADAEQNNEGNAHWFDAQVNRTADELGYRANTARYSAWACLTIHTDSAAEIVVSTHAIGEEFIGVMATSGFWQQIDVREEGRDVIAGPAVLSERVFQFTIEEKEGDVIGRFGTWLDDVIVAGLERWRKQL